MSAIANAAPAAAPLGLVNLNPATAPLVVKGAPSQSANLQEWQDSTGAVKGSMDPAGQFSCGSVSVTGGGLKFNAFSPITGGPGPINWTLQNASNASVNIIATNAASNPLIIKAAASQTADLQQWQSSTGSVLVKVDASGNFDNTSGQGLIKGIYLNTTTVQSINSTGPAINMNTGTSGNITIQARSGSTTQNPLIVQGAASQTADLQQWQSSTAAVLARVDSSGAIAPQNGARITSGSGAPTTPGGINPTAGDWYLRRDGGGAASSNLYLCTVGGASPTWVALV